MILQKKFHPFTDSAASGLRKCPLKPGLSSDIKQKDLYITSLLTFSQYCTRISDALRLSHNNTHPTYS